MDGEAAPAGNEDARRMRTARARGAAGGRACAVLRVLPDAEREHRRGHAHRRLPPDRSGHRTGAEETAR